MIRRARQAALARITFATRTLAGVVSEVSVVVVLNLWVLIASGVALALALVGTGALEPPPSPLVAVSRVADAPRRLWSTLR